MNLFFFRWTGLRDDVEFVLDEELSHIQLCPLHQEMRNRTVTWLASAICALYKHTQDMQ